MLKEEQETTIRFDAEQQEVSIFTAYRPAKTKIERKGYQPVKTSRMDGRGAG